MTVAAMRTKLAGYMAEADEKKIKAIYTLLEADIEDGSSYELTEEQLSILNEREESYMSGKTKGIDRETMHNNIIKKRAEHNK